MCSEIDKRTRDNPEAAMVHANQMRNYLASGPCQAKGDPWPKDGDLYAQREATAGSSQVLAPHPDAIDRAAYERFMRSLG